MLKELYARLYSGRFARNELNLNYFKLIAFRLHQQLEVSRRQARLGGAEPSKFPAELIRKYQQLYEQNAQQLQVLDSSDAAEVAADLNPMEIEA